MCLIFYPAGTDGSLNSQFESVEWHLFFFQALTNKMLIKSRNSKNFS